VPRLCGFASGPCGGKDDAFHIVVSGHGGNWLGDGEVRITFQGEGGRQQEQSSDPRWKLETRV
jgi:hypothetical protein